MKRGVIELSAVQLVHDPLMKWTEPGCRLFVDGKPSRCRTLNVGHFLISPVDTTIQNKALDLAMEWGVDWLKPTQPRLKVLFPSLSEAELNEYDITAQAVMRFGFGFVYDHPNCELVQCAAAVRARFPWVSDENMTRMHS